MEPKKVLLIFLAFFAFAELTGFGKGLYDIVLRQVFKDNQAMMQWLDDREAELPLYFPSRQDKQIEARLIKDYGGIPETNRYLKQAFSTNIKERVSERMMTEGHPFL